MRRRTAGLGRFAHHHDIRDVEGDLPADDPVDRAGLDRIVVEDNVDLGGRGRPAVAEDASALTTHSFSPVRVQSPSPCPPSESKSHDLIWPV